MTGVPRISDSLDYGLAGEPRLLGQVSNNLCLCPVADLIDDARENVRKARMENRDPRSEQREVLIGPLCRNRCHDRNSTSLAGAAAEIVIHRAEMLCASTKRESDQQQCNQDKQSIVDGSDHWTGLSTKPFILSTNEKSANWRSSFGEVWT
ncbi:hypothetical protein FIB18_04285 [Brucella pecoris]|uniref:Uncharacterized protein n=1 Tax=Brucella pecoris TaxID=867683 RepID=A0A5C5CUR7_9HYPH|nr:hypothetical protein FIB18_04285 [Brucella pecoris]